MAANKHTNKLKIQNYAYEISESGQLVQATQDGNYFEIPNESYFGKNGEYPLIEAMDIDWRPYEINGTPVVTTHDVLNSISQNIERLDYLDDAYTYTMDIIEENEEITAQALTNLDTRVLNIENVDLPDLDDRVEILETTYVSHEFLSNIGYVNSPMSYNGYGYAKLGYANNITIGGRVYPIGMEASTGRLGVNIPYQPGDNTITNIESSKEGSGNYVKEIKLSHVDNNPMLTYTLTVSYATLPTLSVEGKNTGTAPDGRVIDSITVNDHKITYSYVSIPTYSYAGKNYVSYGYAGLNYVSYGYAKNTYVPYSYAGLNYVSYGYAKNTYVPYSYAGLNYVSYGYAGLNYASYGYVYAYVASAYADVMMSVDELENRIDNISNDYLNNVEGDGTSGYVIGKLGKNGHKVVYGYVAVPTYEYLRNKSYVYGTGYVTQQYLAEKSYVHGVGYVTQKYLADTGYITQKYLADKSYIYHINDAPTTGYVIGKIGQNGQNLTYAYVAVPTYEYLKNTGYLISSSLDNYVTKPNAIQNVYLGVNKASYVITLSYTIANDPSTTLTNTVDLPLESVVVNGYYNSGYVHLKLTNGNYVKFSVSDLVNGLVSTTDLVNAGYLTSYTYTTAASGSSTTGGYKLDFSDKTYSKAGLSNSTGFNVTIPKAGTDYGVVKVAEGNNLVGINASGQLTYSQPDVSNFITIENIPDIVLSNDGTANGTNRITNIYVDSSNKHKIHIAYATDADTDSYINKFTTSATDNSGFKVSYDYNTKTGSSFTISKAGVGTYGVVKAYQVSTISANTLKAYNGKNYPVSMTANGYAYVAVPWTDTNDNDNTISYVIHKGNGTGNFINGIIVTNTGTNPVTYTVTYSYGTALTSALFTYKDIYSVDLDETWDSTKKKVKIAEGKIISYTNGSTETIAAYNGADIYINVMDSSSYGLAKTYHNAIVNTTINNVTTDAGRYYGVQKNAEGKLVVNVPWASTSTTGFITGADVAYKDIWVVDSDETWDSTKKKVKIAEGRIISYTNKVESIAAYTNADLYVSVMSDSSYGVAKAKGGANGTNFVGISNGFLTYTNTNDNTYTYVQHDTNTRAANQYVDGITVSKIENDNVITYTVTASYSTLPSFANSDTYTYLTFTSSGVNYSTSPSRYVRDVSLTVTGTNPVTYNINISYENLDAVTGGDSFQYPDYDSSSAFFKISTGSGALVDHDLYIPTMNGGTGGSYGVAKAYHTRYINEIPVALQNPDYSDPNRNYGVSIDNNGKLFVNVPWIGGSLNLTQNGPSGTVVSDIRLSGSNLEITYDTVATGQTITALQNAIDNFGARLDNITGYVEVGNGRAIHWDNTAPYPHAYVDLTGFSVGGPSASIQSMSFTNSNNGSLLTVNDGTSHTATLPVMSNTSYGVAQANVVEWHDNFKESLFELQTVDPRNNPSTKKNYKVNIAKHTFDNESDNIVDVPEDTGYLFVSIPVSDFSGGSGSGTFDTVMTTSAYGLAKLGNSTQLTINANNKVYGVGMTSSGQLAVKVDLANVVHYAVCATAGSTSTKSVTVITGFERENGALIYTYFVNTNTASSPSLQVNATAVTPIDLNGFSITAGSTCLFRYHSGTNKYVLIDVAGGSGSGSGSGDYVQYLSNGSGVSGAGPIQKIQVVTSPGTDTNTLYIVL